MNPTVIGDPGGFATQEAPLPVAPAQQVIVINPPPPDSNPWASPTSYRPSTDQFIGAEMHPALKYATPQGTGSQYGPAVVAPAGSPKYAKPPVASPVPAVNPKTLPDGV
jgi:hypothetical protein